MKFIYEYRTSDNVPHQGTIAASSKEAAYDTLKAQGIKPGKVWEAPGVFNKVFGKGKRWIAIVVLLVALLGTTLILCRVIEDQANFARELADLTLYEDRGQIYGSASVIEDMAADEYAAVFSNDVDRFLASYAIPAKPLPNERNILMPEETDISVVASPVSIADEDLEEVKKLKRMVNGIKRELCEYVNAGGTVRSYVQRLDIRQKAEIRIFERAKKELQQEENPSVWKEKNAQLRAMGLPMVERTEAEI